MLRWLATRLLKWGGWTPVGEIPAIDKAVFIAAPHTSNWDGFWLLAYKVAMQVDVRFLAKDSLFWWPLGQILSAMGAMPIDRRDAGGIVPQLVEAFEREDHLFLALAPEGTRSWRPHWKTGFHRIASAARVPIVMAYMDYDKREIGIGPTLPMGRSVETDFETLREFYAGVRGRRPELQGPVTFAAD